MGCTIDLDNFKPIESMFVVFYYSSNFVCYKHDKQIVLSNSDSEMIDISPCPIEYKNFGSIDIGSHIVCLFNGRHVALLNKTEQNGNQLKTIDSNQCVTEMFLGPENNLVFACQSIHGLHLMRYDPKTNQRICQTASLQLHTVNSLDQDYNMFYALFDNSVIASYDMMTGEMIDFRFEAGYIPKKLALYKGDLLYFVHNILNRFIDKKIEKNHLSGYKVHSLEQVIGDNVYFTADDGKLLVSYNIIKKEVVWETKSESHLIDFINCQIQASGKQFQGLVCRSKNGIHVIDSRSGSVLKTIPISNISRLRLCGDYIMVYHTQEKTTILGI